MPLVSVTHTSDGLFGIWKLTEKPEDLKSGVRLSEDEEERFSRLRAESRRTEFLAVRILLRTLAGQEAELEYSPAGKPILKADQRSISISHSADFATVLISEKKVGIDIEKCTREMDRVAHRFLSEREKAMISGFDNPQFATVLFWAAKEAIFKCHDSEGIRFNEQISIDEFVPGRETGFYASLQLPVQLFRYRLQYQVIENNVMVYCVEIGNQLT
jgi:4'-phosphopantetheinyl transferase